MLKTILLLLAVAIVAVLAFAATRPDSFRVERSATIKAPPEAIFAYINDFHNWPQWSPYETKDPAMRRTLSGAESGEGAVYEWQGDKNVGEGRMEITRSVPSSEVQIKLDFVSPFEAHNVAQFTLEPAGDATRVTWAMDGPSPFIAKLMGLFFSMDKMIGTDFAIGLANLKARTET